MVAAGVAGTSGLGDAQWRRGMRYREGHSAMPLLGEVEDIGDELAGEGGREQGEDGADLAVFEDGVHD